MAKALVIGGGPSLDLDFVKGFDGLKLVCDTVLKKCVDYGIKPDFVFTLEDISIFYKLFEGVKAQIVICSLRTDILTINYLKRNNFKIIIDDWKYTQFISNVGLMAFCYACRKLNINEIFLIGLDNCVYKPVIFPCDGIYEILENPEGIKCYLDPIHQLWREQFLDLIYLVPKLQINNYSNGCLFGDRINWCH